MTERWRRTLLRLYPRRVRDRYGAELTDLQDELRARGELTRVGLVRDTVIGALRSRSVRARVALAGAIAAVALVALGLTTADHLTPRRPPAAHAFALVVPRRSIATIPQPCFITAGGSCSTIGACSVFVSDPVSAPGETQVARVRRAVATCVDNPRAVHPQRDFVATPVPVATRLTGRRARAGYPRG